MPVFIEVDNNVCPSDYLFRCYVLRLGVMLGDYGISLSTIDEKAKKALLIKLFL